MWLNNWPKVIQLKTAELGIGRCSYPSAILLLTHRETLYQDPCKNVHSSTEAYF